MAGNSSADTMLAQARGTHHLTPMQSGMAVAVVRSKQADRLRRQFDAIKRTVPPSRPLIDGLLSGRLRLLRLPLAVLLIVASAFAFLPVLGLWMLPLGVLLLAVDLPPLRSPTSALVIRARRRLGLWMRRLRRR
jgi:hypothetical protein